MKMLRKRPLSLAVGAATLALAALTPGAMASSVVVNDTPMTILDTDDSGDGLIFDMFSTVSNVVGASEETIRTTFSITNTKDLAIVIKVRFREQQYSMDVWDALVFLSPYDKIDLVVSRTPGNPVPVVSAPSTEDTCTSLWSTVLDKNDWAGQGQFRENVPFNAEADRADKNAGRWTVGHMEVIAMANIDAATYQDTGWPLAVSLRDATIAKNQQLVFGNLYGCDILKQAFTSSTEVGKIKGATDAPNVLIGRYLIDASGTNALEAGDTPVVLRDTFTSAFLVPQTSASCASDGNQWCRSFYGWDVAMWEHPHLGDIPNLGIYSIEDALEARILQGDWSNNLANNVGTDWIISFVTKYVYMDRKDCDNDPATPNGWCYVLPPLHPNFTDQVVYVGSINPFTNKIGSVTGGWGSLSTASSGQSTPHTCLGASIAGWDIDEVPAYSGVSPGGDFEICNEINVLSMGLCLAGGAGNCTIFDVRDSLIQQNSGPYARKVVPFVIDADAAGVTRGWAEMQLKWPGASLDLDVEADEFGAATNGNLFLVRNSTAAMDSKNNASYQPLARGGNTDKGPGTDGIDEQQAPYKP